MKKLLFLAFVLLPVPAFAGAGTTSGIITSLEPSAYAAATGGNSVALPRDAFALFHNPAALTYQKNAVGISHANGIDGMGLETLSAQLKSKRAGWFSAGIKYYHFGVFESYDLGGESEGSVQYTESQVSLGYANALPLGTNVLFRYGASAYAVSMVIDSLRARRYGVDVGTSVSALPDRFGTPSLIGAVAVKNIGSGFAIGETSKTPLTAEAGARYYKYFSKAISAAVSAQANYYFFDNVVEAGVGADIGLYNVVSLRCGYALNGASPLSFGAGVNIGKEDGGNLCLDVVVQPTQTFGPMFAVSLGVYI